MLDDGSWSLSRGPRLAQIALATFGILALELALIRWFSGQVRLLAYFQNLILIGCFLGMGLGLVLGRRHAGLVHATLPALALLCVPFAFSDSLHLMSMTFPDPAVFLWGAQSNERGAREFATSLFVIVLLFSGIVSVFACAGAAVGHLFLEGDKTSAYSADLLGSLAGVAAVTAITTLGTTPPAWLALGTLPFLWLSRRWLSLLAFVAVVLLAQYSVQGALFSPYNRIDLVATKTGFMLSVNRDFHQYMHDLSDEAVARANAAGDRDRILLRRVYDIPFVLNDRRGSALVIGAGTGNDVQAALRSGYQHVTSVDIDARILEVGRALHPERPYDDARAVTVADDGRAFLARSRESFDVVCYGLVDSHAMFSALSSLRLDNYVYTEQGLRSGWEHVAPRGHMTVAFSLAGGPWLASRLHQTLERATGTAPIVVAHGMHDGATFIVARDAALLRLESVSGFPRGVVTGAPGSVATTSDDWPFLYVKPDVVPWGYLVVLGAVLVLALAGTRLAFGEVGPGGAFDPTLFLMGAGFLLIETRGVTSMSVLFGSTWVVNSAVFSGILAVALAANVFVQRRGERNVVAWFALLLGAIGLLGLVDPSSLIGLPILARGAVGGLLNALPVGFAGVIVSILLRRSRDLPAALASNLIGAVVGGCLEYLSMLLGLRALALLALGLYVGALLTFLRRSTVEKRRPAVRDRGEHGENELEEKRSSQV